MKKLILLALTLSFNSAFAAQPADRVEYRKMDNFMSKNSCSLTHFQHIAVLVDLNVETAQPVRNADAERVLAKNTNLIAYENDSKFIYHSLALKDYYLVQNKHSGAKKLYKVVDSNLNPIANCVVLTDNVKLPDATKFTSQDL